MTTTTIERKNILQQNSDGYLYSIPETMRNEFIHLDEVTQNSEIGSVEWFNARDEFNSVFSCYMVKD